MAGLLTKRWRDGADESAARPDPQTTTQKRRAANEELTTINERLREKVDQLGTACDEAELRTSELQAVLEVAQVAIWIAHDPQCRRITGNRFADEFVMHVPRGTNISASAKTGDKAVAYKVFRNGVELNASELPAQVAAATGKTVPAEALELRFSGNRVAQMFMGATPLFDARGQVRGAVAAGADVTKLLLAEEALRGSETRYRSLFENMINGVAYCRMVFDGEQPVDFVYLAVNRAFETLTGLKDVVGKRVSEIIPGIHQSDPELLKIYARVVRTGKPESFEMNVEALRQWFAVSVYSPAPEHFVAVFDVITDRKQHEAALQRKFEELRAANDELERFNRAAVGRELRMIELKKQVNELCAGAGRPAPYNLDFARAAS